MIIFLPSTIFLSVFFGERHKDVTKRVRRHKVVNTSDARVELALHQCDCRHDGIFVSLNFSLSVWWQLCVVRLFSGIFSSQVIDAKMPLLHAIYEGARRSLWHIIACTVYPSSYN